MTSPPPAPAQPELPSPRHFGDIWHVLQQIAREEDARFEHVSVVDHYNSSGEATKDILRWLHIYHRRLNPAHQFSFPPHHHRHRGYCLLERLWPDGLRWDAFHEETWLRAPLAPAPDQKSLERALDELLNSRAT